MKNALSTRKSYSMNASNIGILIHKIADIHADWGAERISTAQKDERMAKIKKGLEKFEVPHFDLSKPSGRIEAQEFFAAH